MGDISPSRRSPFYVEEGFQQGLAEGLSQLVPTYMRFAGMDTGMDDGPVGGTNNRIRIQGFTALTTLFDVGASDTKVWQAKLKVAAAPPFAECIAFNHHSWTFVLETDRKMRFSLDGSGLDFFTTGVLSTNTDHVVTVIRNAAGNAWKFFIDSDAQDSTFSATAAKVGADYIQLLNDDGGPWRTPGNIVQAFRLWTGGVYTVPSALDPDDAAFTWVAVEGY